MDHISERVRVCKWVGWVCVCVYCLLLFRVLLVSPCLARCPKRHVQHSPAPYQTWLGGDVDAVSRWSHRSNNLSCYWPGPGRRFDRSDLCPWSATWLRAIRSVYNTADLSAEWLCSTEPSSLWHPSKRFMQCDLRVWKRFSELWSALLFGGFVAVSWLSGVCGLLSEGAVVVGCCSARSIGW